MRSIFSIVVTAVLLLSVLTGCGTTTKTDEARNVTTSPAAETDIPMETAMPGDTGESDLGEDMREFDEDLKEDGEDVVNDLVGEDGQVADGELTDDERGDGESVMEDERDADKNTAMAGQ